MHALFTLLVSGCRPGFGYRNLYAYTFAPGIYLRRSDYLAICLAPLFLISGLGLALLNALPPAAVPALLLLLAWNASTSFTDLVVSAWLFTQPGGALFDDDGFTVRAYAIA